MSRYIDADDAIKAFEELHGKESNLLNLYNADWIVSFIEARLSADVQEVKHARWLPFYEDYRHQIVGDKCSLCGYSFFGGTYEHNYCPRCGARMDEEERE